MTGPIRPANDEAAAWMIRAGSNGEQEEAALQHGLVLVGWEELGDISYCRTKEELRDELRRTYRDDAEASIGNWMGQLWRFTKQIREGDLVVMPMKTRPGRIAVGRVIGPYQYRADKPVGFRHVRKAEWLRTDITREAIRPDLRASLGSLLTVCGLARYDAARRIAHLAEHGVDPGVDGEEEITTSAELLEDAASRGPGDPRRLTIRNFLEHWGEARRTGAVITRIKADLAEKGLATRPPFAEGRVDDYIELVPVGAEPGSGAHVAADTEDVSELPPVTLRIGNLPPPAVVSVPRTVTLTYTKTLLLKRQFSQLAVIDLDGTFRGAVSWESIGKAHIASNNPSLEDAIAPAIVVDHDALLLEQIEMIYSKGFVFVLNADRSRVEGIVTAADLTRQFGNLARPFVLIEEAENRLRRRADEVFTTDELRNASLNPQRVHQAADLTFGNYARLVGPEAQWAKLEWDIDRKLFLELLEEVRKVRNELMHFTPDPLSPGQYAGVDGLLELLRTVDPRP